MREWEKEKERDREIESDSSGSIPPTPLPCPQFLLELRVSGLSCFFVDRVAWRTSRCYGHHSSGWASVGPSLQGPPRQRKSIEIRTWGRALKAVPAKQENNTEKVASACVFLFPKSHFMSPADISISSPIRMPLREFLLELSLCYTLCYRALQQLENSKEKVIPDMFQPDFMVFDRKVRQGVRKTIIYLAVQHKHSTILYSGHWIAP